MNDCVKHPAFSEVTVPDSTMQTGTQSTKEATMQEPTPTPVFDFTATINAALAQAIQIHTAPLVARIEVLERSLVVADKATQGNETELFSRVALLEGRLHDLTTASEERIKEIAEEVAEQAISEHKYEYDHDDYDSIVNIDEKIDEAINDLDLEDKLRDALRGMTFDITARY